MIFWSSGGRRKGLPEPLLRANEPHLLTIPMHGTRSLNLATAVAIVLFEAVRQTAASVLADCNSSDSRTGLNKQKP